MMLAAVFLLTTALALPQEVQVPANDGWVTDLAGLLAPDEERALEALCESFRAGSTHEIALLIVPDLDGQPIERLALAVGRGWELGVEGQDNGALLLVAQAERALRIEVGRGLEGVLTDLTSGRIIRERIAPAFREGEYYAGLRAGLVAMHSALGGEYGESTRSEAVEVGEGVALLVFMLILLFLMARSKSSRRGMQAGIPWWIGPMLRGSGHSSRGPFAGGIGGSLGGSRGGGFSGFGGGGGFRGGGATGGW